MHRAVAALILSVVLVNGLAQTPTKPSPDLKFEVASLKPTPPDVRPNGIRPAPGGERYDAVGVPLRLLIMVAYRVKAEQITGGPAWMATDLFDMHAKAEKASSVEELHVMLQNLLAERFHLQFHHEMKELPIYAMTVDKNGSKMTPHQAASAGDPWIDQAQVKFLHNELSATFCPMDYLAWRLGQLVDLPVVDQTNLKGGFDFKLSYTADLPPNIPADAHINGEAIDLSGPSIFEALRQQLGLKLEKTKGPVDIIAIDRAEKPDGN